MGHHVVLSVAGADRTRTVLMSRSWAALARKVPHTIVRATQFFEFHGAIAGLTSGGGTVRVSAAPMQPLAADDVAAALADVLS